MKQNSIPNTELQTDLNDRLCNFKSTNSFLSEASVQKIISTDNLSYIPNLYFRKCKLIETLNHFRFDFPQQKILLPRQKTTWDAVLCQMKEKAELRKEVKHQVIKIQKFKIAQNYHVAQTAKQEFIKKELKKEQRQLFHRIIANQLAQEVKELFNKNNPSSAEQTQKPKQSEIHNNLSNGIHDGRGTDDIFIDKHQDQDYLEPQNRGDIDFFDDILNDGVANKQPLALMNQQSKVIEPQAAPKRTIQDYINDFNQNNQKNNQNKMQEQEYFLTESHVSRRACLKKINQNLRRRLKSKGAETEDRSLTSATVALSGLINNYPECKDTDNFVDVPSETDWMFDDNVRSKKKKVEQFGFIWSDEELQKLQAMNPATNFRKIIQAPSLLQLTMQKNQYPKIFQRNIATNYNFPSNIESIRKFSKKFDKKKFYYNDFYDQEYEMFIKRNNKQKLLGKFEQKSNNMFAENYVQQEIGSDEKIGFGKVFLYSPNKISERIIYKVVPNTHKISITTKEYNKKNTPLSRQKMIFLSFLVNQYLTEFGNDWKTITEFIEIFPCFSNYLIKPELVQELYQMINRHQLKIHHLENLQIWDKKILPANQLYNGSYKDFKNIVKEKELTDIQMIDEGSATQYQQSEEFNNFSLEDYETTIKQPLKQKENKKSFFSNLSKNYKKYGSNLHAKTTNDTYLSYENKVRKANKIINQYRSTFGVTRIETSQKPQNEDKVLEYVQKNMKGQVKNGIPFRKKKNINERNNELVKILQALRSKNTSNMPQPGTQKSLPESSKQSLMANKTQGVLPSTNVSAPVVPPQNVTPKPSQNPTEKQQKKTKTPQKRVSGAVAPTKKPKKKEGQEQKQKK